MTPLELALAITPIIGSVLGSSALIWRHIDSQFDLLRDRMGNLAAYDAVERERLDGKIEMLEYRINANTELIKHKSTRLETAIGQIAGYLSKDGFGVRESCLYWPSDDNPIGPPS